MKEVAEQFHNDDASCMDVLVFKDSNGMYQIFNGIKILAIIITAYLYPYLTLLRGEEYVKWLFISSIFEYIFLLDILLNFCKITS